MCSLHAFCIYWSIGTLLWLQAALALNRWMAVCLSPNRTYSIYTSLFAAVSVPIFTAVILMVPVTKVWGELGWDSGTSKIRYICSHFELFPKIVMVASNHAAVPHPTKFFGRKTLSIDPQNSFPFSILT